MAHETSNSHHSAVNDRISSSGTNTGAYMFIDHRHATNECCCINIHVNNNIQGVTNSLVLGSKVTMRDPGVHLVFKQGCREKGESPGVEMRTDASISSVGFEFWVLLAMLFVVVSIFLKLAV